MKGYENDEIVKNMELQLSIIEKNVLSGYDEHKLADPRNVVRAKKEIVERQRPIIELMTEYIAMHPVLVVELTEDQQLALPEKFKE
jgi:hypothetical protein